ncbi:MAG: glycosyltransferase family 2 protein [Pseudomonadota bacterium]
MSEILPDTSGPRPWVSVIIVNHNGGRFLQPALDAVAAQEEAGSLEVILVDNASSDGSFDDLRTDHLPSFHALALDENTGFARGNNLAVNLARGDWIALLNPDTEAAPDWLAAFRRAKETYPDTAMFAGATIDMTNPDLMDGAGDCYFGLGIPWRGGYQRPVTELPSAGECFSPCGASALFRRDAFLAAGGFDERFFCYCEDVDIGFRLRLEGERCVFWPDARVRHFGSGTTSVASPFAVRHGTRNRLWTFVKNMPPLALILLFPLHIALTCALLVRGAMKGRAGPTWAGLWEGVSGLPAVWADRRRVQARRKLSSLQILKAMSWNWNRVRQRRTDVREFEGPGS